MILRRIVFTSNTYKLIPIIDLCQSIQLLILNIRNEEFVRHWMFTENIISVSEHLAWIERLKTDTGQLYFVIIQNDIHPVGSVNLKKIDKNKKTAELGFYKTQSIDEKGLMTASLFTLIDYAFDVLGLEKIYSEVFEGNIKSVNIHKKLLFTEEGFSYSHITKEGVSIGVHLFELKKNEWKSGRNEININYSIPSPQQTTTHNHINKNKWYKLKNIYRIIIPKDFRNIFWEIKNKFYSFILNIKIIIKSIPVFINYLIHNNNKFEDELSIVAIMKNEGAYLQEWIEYHKLIGVTRFYLYDNESTDNTKDIIAPYISDGTVIYSEIPGKPDFQGSIYYKTAKKYQNKTRWLAAIDLDEFLVPICKTTINDVLQDIRSTIMKNKIFVGLAVHWVIYGYSGHFEKPEGLVIENYTKSAGVSDFIKSIINPRTIISFSSSHYANYFFGIQCVNENGIPTKYTKHKNEKATDKDIKKIRINHYRTKSYSEYKERLEKNQSGWAYCGDMPPFDLSDESWNNYLKKQGIIIYNKPDKEDMVMNKYIPLLKNIGM